MMARPDQEAPIFVGAERPRTVWKFTFPDVVPYWEFKAPRQFAPIYFATQFEIPTLWAEVDPESTQIMQRFIMVGTGGSVPTEAVHVGSFQTQGGEFIWHVYWLPDWEE